jgi:AraC-like DNA-binding protein
MDKHYYIPDVRGDRMSHGVSVAWYRRSVGKTIIPWGVHGRYVLQYIIEGNALYKDENGTQCNIGPESFFFRKVGVNHSITSSESSQDWCECYVSLGGALREMIEYFGLFDGGSPIIPNVPKEKVLPLFKKMCDMAERTNSENINLLEVECLKLMVVAKSYLRDNDHQPKTDGSVFVNQMLTLIHENLYNEQSIDKLIEARVTCSYSHARAVFRKVMKMSPGQYRLNKRMEIACSLLEEGHRRVSEVAEILNYADVFTFSRQFKKVMGVSPKFYRTR